MSGFAHVAVFLPSLRGGGAERVMLQLANAMAAQEVNIDLLLTRAEGSFLDEVSSRARIVDFARRRTSGSLLSLRRYLLSVSPDALISALDNANVVSMLAKMTTPTPTRHVITVHNSPTRQARVYRGLRRAATRILVRQLFPRADAIVAVSQGLASEVAESLGVDCDRIVTIYNPVISDRVFSLARSRPAHAWFTNDPTPIIVAAGRLTRQKGFITLVKALALIKERTPARLIVLGEGPLRPALQRTVDALELDDRVELHGFADNPYGFMRHAALFVLSSRWEGLPTVLIEALALGVPIVSTDCPSGPREILRNGTLGTLVPVGDERALAEAMLSALSTPPVPRPKDAWLPFSVARSVENYLSLLHALR